MRTFARSVPTFGLVLIMTIGSAAEEAKLNVVAAENFYGDIAQQIGGDFVNVVSIMSNPDQDPHLFETTPTVIRQVGAAQVVIFNGSDYDPWMNKLISATPRAGRIVVDVAELMGTKRGANPHLWYSPATVPAVAKALVGALSVHLARLMHAMQQITPRANKLSRHRSRLSSRRLTRSVQNMRALWSQPLSPCLATWSQRSD
jgi:ABC-type Zn uptake system ZnuABC Zn-binding protein ZnuA